MCATILFLFLLICVFEIEIVESYAFAGKIPNDWYMTKRIERNKDLIHFEFHPKPTSLSNLWNYLLPARFKSKPLAKVGMRGQPADSAIMREKIASLFPIATKNKEDKEEEDIRLLVTVFVYMWVNEAYRGRNIGDYLLALAVRESQAKGVDYMLLIHDDKGDGKLINYYKQRDFVPVFDFIDKGMVKYIKDDDVSCCQL